MPLSRSAQEELHQYLALRRKTLNGCCQTAPLLFNGGRKPSCYSGGGLGQMIRNLILAANIRDSGGRRPCVHSMRHYSGNRIILATEPRGRLFGRMSHSRAHV